ncbi:uncharacterized protein [Aegilops tauschii subsp. strangulata]|uniref:uncharacterized protein n=1 Tax=Aegilops tauschii subsp. strangulata TaxID=200361 RepID=UPI001ABC361E|nr:uncharacterized protein LOC120966706 [Aegilops tauschii subsp. strangulata]
MSDCSTGTDSPRADSVDKQPPADAESPDGGQSKRDHPSPSSPLSPPKRSRRSVERRVVSVPIAECGERAKTNGEGPPPSRTPQAQARLGAAGRGEASRRARPGTSAGGARAYHGGAPTPEEDKPACPLLLCTGERARPGAAPALEPGGRVGGRRKRKRRREMG